MVGPTGGPGSRQDMEAAATQAGQPQDAHMSMLEEPGPANPLNGTVPSSSPLLSQQSGCSVGGAVESNPTSQPPFAPHSHHMLPSVRPLDSGASAGTLEHRQRMHAQPQSLASEAQGAPSNAILSAGMPMTAHLLGNAEDGPHSTSGNLSESGEADLRSAMLQPPLPSRLPQDANAPISSPISRSPKVSGSQRNTSETPSVRFAQDRLATRTLSDAPEANRMPTLVSVGGQQCPHYGETPSDELQPGDETHLGTVREAGVQTYSALQQQRDQLWRADAAASVAPSPKPWHPPQWLRLATAVSVAGLLLSSATGFALNAYAQQLQHRYSAAPGQPPGRILAAEVFEDLTAPGRMLLPKKETLIRNRKTPLDEPHIVLEAASTRVAASTVSMDLDPCSLVSDGRTQPLLVARTPALPLWAHADDNAALSQLIQMMVRCVPHAWQHTACLSYRLSHHNTFASASAMCMECCV
jgi:hypothetical protein